jgi:hypothetical protein
VAALACAAAALPAWPQAPQRPQIETRKGTLRLGGTALELSYVGLNHSDSTLVMRLPKERLIFVVDLIPVGTVPGRGMIGFHPLEAEESIKRILAMDWDRMIPGRLGRKMLPSAKARSGPIGVGRPVAVRRAKRARLIFLSLRQRHCARRSHARLPRAVHPPSLRTDRSCEGPASTADDYSALLVNVGTSIRIPHPPADGVGLGNAKHQRQRRVVGGPEVDQFTGTGLVGLAFVARELAVDAFLAGRAEVEVLAVGGPDVVGVCTLRCADHQECELSLLRGCGQHAAKGSRHCDEQLKAIGPDSSHVTSG